MLNANYLLAQLRDSYDLPYDRLCMHEFVLSARTLKREHGDHRSRRREAAPWTTGSIRRRSTSRSSCPEALMIEPTETEAKETLDAFAEAMRTIAAEAPERILSCCVRRRTHSPSAVSTR